MQWARSYVNLVTLLSVLGLWVHTQAIYRPGNTPQPKIKERVDFKAGGDNLVPTTSRPPIRVYTGGRGRGGPPPPPHPRLPASAGDGVYGGGVARAGSWPTADTTGVPRRTHHMPESNTPARRAQGVPGVLTCPGPNGLFPYVQDCSKFINCAGGRPHLQSCGPGTLFNAETSTCDWPHAVTCYSTPSHSTPGGSIHALGRSRDPGSSIDSLFDAVSDTARSATDSLVNAFTDLVEDNVNIIREQVEWTYERAKDKGKRVLNDLGVKDSAILCLRPDGVFPYPKDCAKFVNCWRSRPSLQRCAPGTLFNSAKGFCDFPHKTVCPKSRAPPSRPSVSYVVAPASGQRVRLRGGDVPWAGYVQVSGTGGTWRLVTDTPGQWTAEDASVVCRSLGFTRGAESAFQGRTFGLVPGQIAMIRQVECEGTEEHLLQCRLHVGSQEDVDKTVVGVRCVRNWVSECRENGVRWGHKCYYMITSELVSHAQARDSCSSRGARLLTITSQVENDFVSEMLSSAAGESVGFHTGGVRTQIFDDVFWIWQNTSSPPTRDLDFTLWWPGWNVTEAGRQRNGDVGVVTGEAVVTGEGAAAVTYCVVIRDNFPVPQGSGEGDERTSAPAEYYFWQLSDCGERLHFVCETEKEDIGCVEERGMTYSGRANITARGEPCLPWGHPQVQTKVRDFPLTHGLRDNHCANPDGDDIPWCFTAKGSAEFCDIPRCERTETHMEVVENLCPPDKFACTSGGCILQEFQCDGRTDCEDGSDESGCHDYSLEFSKRINHKLQGNEVEKWLYTLKTTCAARCVQAKNFVCMSFNYQQSSETCLLSKSNVGLSGGLVTVGGWEYYEHKSLALNCSGKFVCWDGRCLDASQQCDGRRDCKDGEDELECKDQVNFEVRLVNGSNTHEGRVEVRAFGRWGPVCDDMWSVLEGDVVCHELGFTLGAKEVFHSSHYGSGNGQYIMDDLNCKGNEESLADCDFAGWGEHDCQASEAAGVMCFRDGDECGRDQWRCTNGRCVALGYLCDTVDDCHDASDEDRDMCQANLEVRLVGKEASGTEGKDSEGRLEVRYLGVWGTVCDDDFGIEEGHVLCRMMGWAGVSHVHKNSTFGPGSGRVWLDDLQCLGYEKSVMDCQHLPWGQNNCNHDEDVGLSCSDTPASASEDELDGPMEATPAPPMSLPLTCGRREVEDAPATPMERPKIVSGRISPPGAHPWMVAINLQTRSGPTQWCGGAVLGEEYVLTAAHCVFKYPASTYLLRIGDFNIEVNEEEEQEFRVSSLAIHPEFDKGPFLNNDIAILKVKKKNGKGIQFGKFVQPLCLVPRRWKYPPYMNCTVAGWGSMGATLGFSKVLQSTLLPILPEETCKADYVYGSTRLAKGMYCAGYLEGGIDTCQGDSGGPMVCSVDGRYTVVGITSWGHGCARPNKPGVYTRLTHYLPWLYSSLG